MNLRRPSWPARLLSGVLALLLAVMQTMLVAHAVEHGVGARTTESAGFHGSCGHDHGEGACSLCRLVAQSSADTPPPELRVSAFGSCLSRPPLRAPESPRAVEFWICTGPRGPPASV